MRPQIGTIWLDGGLASWDQARIPLMSDALLRGLSAFDGLIARRLGDGSLALVAPVRHIDRLARTCVSLGLPIERTQDALLEGCCAVAAAEAGADTECDVYVRPMIVGAALTERAKSASITIAAFRQQPKPVTPVRLTTTSWRRPAGDAMPASLKVVGNYQLSRLARMEAKGGGFDDAVVINAAGRVAETAGSAILAERDGGVLTPPAWEDCLDSITVAVLAALAGQEGIEFERMPLQRTDILSATGLALAGTLADVVPVSRIDHRDMPRTSPALEHLRVSYVTASRGGKGFDLLEPVAV